MNEMKKIITIGVVFIRKCFMALIAMCGLFCSCSQEKAAPLPLFKLMENTGINFRNDVLDSKEDNSFLFRNFYNGGGVALGDINNDNLPDVFLTSNQGENKLYLNKGNWKFEDISSKAELKQEGIWSTGVTMVDINADGWLDIYVCSSGNMHNGNRRNRLYINNRDLTFTEDAANYGLAISGYCTQAAFFDYDKDDDLDCFLINNSPIPFSSLDYAGMRDVDINKWTVDEKLKGGGNHLYQNNDGKFTEVTKKAGLHTGLISFGLGVSVGDLNDDGYPDVYVGNDFIEKDYLYINQKDGTFVDELEQRIQKISMSSMSTDLADINNDGHSEIFTTDMIPDDDYRLKTTGTFDNIDLYLSKQKAGLYHQYVRNCLQLNNGDGSFSEVSNFTGTYGTDWSWGAVFFDADNDGWNDILICNGIAKDVGDLDFLDFFSNDVYTKMVATGQRTQMDELLKHIPSTPLNNRMFRNKGDLSFEDVTSTWGFTQQGFSNSVAYADMDNDGDLDVIISKENGPAAVYQNNAQQQTKHNYIGFQLEGKKENPFAVGAKIKVYKEGKVLYREVAPVRGFQSCMEYRQFIGLGKDATIDSVVVDWPDGTKDTHHHLAVNKVHQLKFEDHDNQNALNIDTVKIFAPVDQIFEKHTEDEHIDFYFERNLPQMLSRQGPHLAIGDVNGDGTEDIFIGGAKHQSGQLYIQQPNGTFLRSRQPAFEQFADFEDVAVLFFDADADKDLDLFVGAGGNNVQPGERSIEHRLYLNNGKGNFSLNPSAFPANRSNISVATAYDYDGDGDEDLFVGGRSLPFSYGVSPASYLYRNNAGRFTDVSLEVNPKLASIGMVTCAVWTNVYGDAKKELVVTGEWMATRVFTIQSGRLKELRETGLATLFGWWQSIAAADVNSDGKEDLIIGNIGENFYLRPSADKPAKLWLADFDQSGTTDYFLTQTINGKDMPVFLKREVTEQFPFLKKQNLKHSDYARKSIQDLFGNSLLNSADTKHFNYCSSIIAINKGNGKFVVQLLPTRAQLSSVNAICVTDINSDGKTDLLLGGNLFTFPPQFGRLDASYGEVLTNDGKGGFTWVDYPKTGLRLNQEVKDIEVILVNGKRHLLVTQNNKAPLLYKWR